MFAVCRSVSPTASRCPESHDWGVWLRIQLLDGATTSLFGEGLNDTTFESKMAELFDNEVSKALAHQQSLMTPTLNGNVQSFQDMLHGRNRMI